ncbi:hypothetical protein LCGC14_2975130, partial [marine sediment metagenome]
KIVYAVDWINMIILHDKNNKPVLDDDGNLIQCMEYRDD